MNDSHPNKGRPAASSSAGPVSADVTEHGNAIVMVDVIMTGAFVSSALLAAIVFASPWKNIAVVVSLLCFTLGVVSFLWGYWNAVQRSRGENIGVAALYFLTDGVAPRRVARLMNCCLGVQTVCGIATALARHSTDGRPGSTLAFGILVPMMGLGLNGLWGAFHGSFDPRGQIAAGSRGGIRSHGPESGQDTDHD